MIDDQELRDLFKAESDEHLRVLEAGLLRLESEPGDAAALEEVFREAHSLKGAARMLGLSDIELLSHRLEDVLGNAHRGHESLASGRIDQLLQAVDILRQLSGEAVTGMKEGGGADIVSIIEKLDVQQHEMAAMSVEGDAVRADTDADASASVVAVDEAAKTADADGGAAAQPQAKEKGAAPAEPKKADEAAAPSVDQPAGGDEAPYQISTVRVSTSRLDSLMTHAGELAVTRLRIARRQTDLEELAAIWESWSSEISQQALAANARQVKHWASAASQQNTQERERYYLEQIGGLLGRIIEATNQDTAHLESISNELADNIHAIRLLPMSTVFGLFDRTVRDVARQQEKEVKLVVEGGETRADKHIIEVIKDPLMHMIRNAIDHGIEEPGARERTGKPRSGTIRLKAYQITGNIMVEVTDDGAGLDVEAIKRSVVKRKILTDDVVSAMSEEQLMHAIFMSGVSTSGMITDMSGRGVGLDVVKKSVEKLKGVLQVQSQQGRGCTISMRLPITLATLAVLIVSERGAYFAVPIEFVESLRMVGTDEVFPVDGRDSILFEDEPVSVVRLSDILELPEDRKSAPIRAEGDGSEACVILSVAGERIGILVDDLLDEQEVVLKQHGKLLKRVRNVSGSTILGTGEVCTVLNPHDMIKSVQQAVSSGAAPRKKAEQASAAKTLLLVEDSIITRTQEKRILEAAGYEVVTAVDGLDAIGKLKERDYDAVVSDIQMPNMDGLALTEKLRGNEKYKTLPIILVTSLSSDEDKKRGLQVGADAYIPKPSFDQKTLLETLGRLVV